MKRLLFLLVAVSTPLLADEAQLLTPQITKPASEPAEGDPLQEKYEAAWFHYEKAIGEVRDKVNAALDAQFEKAADAGNLDLADMWDKKKKLFADTGSLSWPSDGKTRVEWRKKHPPTEFPHDFSEVIAAAVSGYEKAVATLKDDYESLVKDYTKDRNLSRAKALREEAAALGATPPAGRPRMSDANAKGSGNPDSKSVDTEPDPADMTEGDKTYAKLLRTKFAAARITLDPKSGVLTLVYDFTKPSQLNDFTVRDAPSTVAKGLLRVPAAETLTHVAEFTEGSISGRFTYGNTLGNQPLMHVTGAAQLRIDHVSGGTATNLFIELHSDGAVRARKDIGLRTPLAIQWDVAPNKVRVVVDGKELAGTRGRPQDTGRFLLHGGNGGLTASEVTISGIPKTDWFKAFMDK
jgi:hypothetical protein